MSATPLSASGQPLLPPGDAFALGSWRGRVFWLGLALLVAVLPQGGTIALRYLALLLCGGAFIAGVWQRQVRFSLPLLGPWLLYGAVALLSLAYAQDTAYSLSEIRVEIVVPALLCALASCAIRSAAAFRRLLWLVVASCAFYVLYSLATALAGGSTKDGLVGTLETGVGNFSTYLVMVMPVIAAFAAERWSARRRQAAGALLLLLLASGAALAATLNRQGFVALGAEVAVLALWLLLRGAGWRTWAALGLLAGLLLLLLLGLFGKRVGSLDLLAAVHTDPRWPLWQFALTDIDAHPWAGGGFGLRAFQMLHPDYASGTMLWHAHNMILNKGVQMGWPGMLAFVLLLAAVPWYLRRGWRRSMQAGGGSSGGNGGGNGGDVRLRAAFAVAGMAMVAGMVVKNLTDDFFLREQALFFWLLIGAQIGLIRGSERVVWPKLLVIRRDNIGDLLCTTPLIRALRQHYPAARIDALVNSYNAPVLHGNPDLDQVYAYTKGKHRAAGETALAVVWRRLRLMLNLRHEHYDLVVLAGTGASARPLALARWVGARRVVGANELRQDGHEVERVFAKLAELGMAGEPPAMVLVPDAARLARARQQLQAAPWYAAGRRTVAIHISARKPLQRWPAELFVDLLRALAAENCQFLLFWSPGDENHPQHPGDDRKAAQIIAAAADLPLLPYPTAELDDLIAGLAVCDAMVCSDGGAMHVAAALGKPVQAFFGNSDASRWRPWGVPYTVLQKESRTVAEISVAEALAAFRTLG